MCWCSGYGSFLISFLQGGFCELLLTLYLYVTYSKHSKNMELKMSSTRLLFIYRHMQFK